MRLVELAKLFMMKKKHIWKTKINIFDKSVDWKMKIKSHCLKFFFCYDN